MALKHIAAGLLAHLVGVGHHPAAGFRSYKSSKVENGRRMQAPISPPSSFQLVPTPVVIQFSFPIAGVASL